jgi:hypothetical protein
VSLLKIGDNVSWCRALSAPSRNSAIGTITAVINSDSGLHEFAMYDIKFTFGTFTLYGTQIQLRPYVLSLTRSAQAEPNPDN